jgi:hypothetical protein
MPWLAVAVILCAGCSRTEQSPEPTVQPTAASGKAAAAVIPPEPSLTPAPVDAPAPWAPAQLAAANQPDPTPALTTALRRWMIAHKRAPTDFEEFSAGMQFPPPPPGKKYIIGKNNRVELVAQ